MGIDRPTRCYASPLVLFRGRYVFRTLNGTMAVLISFLASVICTVLAVFVLKTEGEVLPKVVATIVLAGALIFGGLGLRALWGWVRNERIYVEINERGVVRGNRFWPWERIQLFTGTRYDNGVTLEFTPRWNTIVWGGGQLPTTPLLTVQQYVELAHELSQFLSTRFPHVEVAMQPQLPRGD